VGVEPTILAAKDRINGFEGHEDHRTSFASVWIIEMRGSAFNLASSILRRNAGEFSAREIEKLWIGAHFVIRAGALRADFRAGK
jgi:hypothetical protein